MDAVLEHHLHPNLCLLLALPPAEAVARVYGRKDAGEFPKPHRLPFYPYLDPRRQRRELRALKVLGVEAPNPHPRHPETGKPIEPPPTHSALQAAALAAEEAIKEKLAARLSKAAVDMQAMSTKLTEHAVGVKSVNAMASWEKLELAIERATAALLKHGESALSSPVAVSPDKARELLAHRLRRWSKFGSTCPVMLVRYKRLISPAVKVALPDSFPVVYGPHIYLCKTQAAREAFMADVVPLSQQRPPQVLTCSTSTKVLAYLYKKYKY